LVLAVTLLALGYERRSALDAQFGAEPPAVGEGELVAAFDPEIVWDSHEPEFYLALGINAPAVLPALPVAAMLRGRPLAGLGVFLVSLVALWYWVGLGIDRRLGAGSRPLPKTPSGIFRVACTVAFLVCIAALILGVYGISEAFFLHVRLFYGAFSVWSLVFAIYFGQRLRIKS
jgi:hypothetical protein